AAIRSMDAAALAGVSRYVMISWFYDAAGHGISPEVPFYHYAEAKAAADTYLRGTDLQWTILGPSTLTDDPGTGRIEVGGQRSQVTRDDVAHLAAEVLARPETIGKTINYSNGATAIPEALAAL